MNAEQYAAIVKQAQVRFGCTEAQAVRLAKSFASDTGKGKGVMVGRVDCESGLATLRFPNGMFFGAMPPAIRLVRLLQHIEGLDKEGLIAIHDMFQLTPEMDSWLRNAPEPSELVKPIMPQEPSNPPVYVPEAFKKCRCCGRPAIPGSDTCYTCKSD